MNGCFCLPCQVPMGLDFTWALWHGVIETLMLYSVGGVGVHLEYKTCIVVSTPLGLFQFLLSLIYFQSRLCPPSCFQSRMNFVDPDKPVSTSLEVHKDAKGIEMWNDFTVLRDSAFIFCGLPAIEVAGSFLV